MGIGNIFHILLINPIFNILLVFIFVFSTWALPGALGWAIIALTSMFRIAFSPLYKKQMHMATQMEVMRPKLEALQKKYKGDPKKIQQEQLKLYQEHGINPASGCLLAIIQIPLVIALYQVLLSVFQGNNLAHISELTKKTAYFEFLRITHIDPQFLGFNLGIAPSTFNQNGLYYLIIPVLTAFLQYLQLQVATPSVKKTPDSDKELAKKDGKPGEKKEESFQEVFQKQSKFMFPLMVGYFSYILPVGLALYWNVFSLFSILQAKEKVWKKK